MVEAKILLEINSESMTIDIKGDEAALISLLFIACEHSSDMERIIERTLDVIAKRRVDEVTGNLPNM